jgi:hypothetical protein
LRRFKSEEPYAEAMRVLASQTQGHFRYAQWKSNSERALIVGVQTRYGDFRDIGGMQLPFRAVATFASELIGVVATTLDSAETGVEVSQETFAAPTAPK